MKQQVGIFIGRFQPFTKKHIEIINKMSDENDEVFVIVVRGKETSKDKERNPFSEKEQIKMINLLKVQPNVHFYFNDTAYFFDIFDENFYDFRLYCGSDRLESYKNSFKDKIAEYIEIERTVEDISASKVRELIRKKQSVEDYCTSDIMRYLKSKYLN